MSTSAPFLHPDGRLKTTWSTLGVLAGLLVAGAISWAVLRAEVQQTQRDIDGHDRRIETLESRFDAQREMLIEIRADMKVLVRERRLETGRLETGRLPARE